MLENEAELRGMDEDPRRQRRHRLLQRAGWLSLAALLVAVSCGLFGRGGPLSAMRAASPDGALLLEYDRFMRYHSPDSMAITVASAGTQTRVSIDARYAERIEIERITPRPDREIAGGGALTFVFATRPGTHLRATLHFAPERYGSLEGWIAAGDGPPLPFSQFVYP